MTGIVAIILEIITVVEGQFFARKDVANRDDPDVFALEERLAIRFATVIYETGRVPLHITIEIKPIADGENIFVLSFTAAKGFRFRNLLAGIFQNAQAT